MSAHDTQQKILDFIVNHIEREGIPPTQREIAEAMKLARSSVDYHLTMLEKKGLITRESKKSRGIHLLQTYKKVPVWGRITTDESGLSVRSSLKIYSEPQEWIDVGQDLAGGNTYALIVQGGSMVEEHIRDGDYVVIKPQAYYENGDIIVAVHITHDGSANATLKRFFQGKDQVRLQPANSELNPIYVPRTEWDREWRVQGKVVALFRHLAVQRASPQDESSTYTIQDSRSSQDVTRRVYNLIVDFIESRGIPPTNREIGKAMGITSTGHVDYHLTMLEKKGLITRESKKSRGIKLSKRYKEVVPVEGRIAAGEPLEIYSEPGEWIDVGQDLAGENIYALLVKGRSMIGDHICDGDYVVINRLFSYPQDGDIIVAVHLWSQDDEASATLKRFRFFREERQVCLQPSNSESDPIFIPFQEWDREWQVQGKVVALFRHWAVQRASPQGEPSTYTIQDSGRSQDVTREVYNIPAKRYPSVEKPTRCATK